MIKYFFNIADLDSNQLRSLLDLDVSADVLKNKNIGLIFEKPSTRTRLSFKVGIINLGGNSVDLNFNELNISRYESYEDTFKTMDCYLDGIIYRTSNHDNLIEASKYFKKPIINALSDISHPCQIISDLLTLRDHFGSLKCNILWMGDMNNVCFSLVEAVNLIKEMSLTICSPKSISSSKEWKINSNISIKNNLNEIDLKLVNCVMTDVFISMNDEDNKEKESLLKSFKVDSNLMSNTSPDSVFMHCLPAKVGYEVSEKVFRSSKSIVWKQAYNRLIAQNKLLHYIFR